MPLDLDAYMALVDESPAGLIVWTLDDPDDDASLTLTLANKRAFEFLRVDLRGRIGERMLDIFPQVPAERRRVYAEVIRTGRPWTVVTTSGASGREEYFAINAVPLGRSVAVHFENLTFQKTAEGDLRRLGLFLDSVLETLPLMVFVKEAENLRFERINRAGEELLGVSRADLLGKNDYDFFPKEQADFFVAADRATLAAGEAVDIPEEPIQTASGERWLHTKKVPICDIDGRRLHLLGISVDITERRRVDLALRSANGAMEAAFRELEAFSYSVAHDLRAPLRAIDGFTQALAEDYGERFDEGAREHVRRIRAATARTGRIIDDLLELSRVTRRETRIDHVDLSALAREVLAETETEAPRAGRHVDWVVEDGLAVRADRGLVRIVLLNLVANAFKFTSRRARARIEIGATRTKDGERAYFVRDDGVGFDMAYAAKLFRPFERLHSDDDFDGTGIGLAIVARAVARHGGRVWAESAPDQGATFFMTFGP